ncbi:MAG: ADP-ribosylglycohydrolase family protein [Thioploca sp.]|nr:ADP-ribosylglycohydrolase family protein [Thioploca sp.]
MRVAPIGVFFRNNAKQMNDAAGLDAIITHAHQDAIDASVAMVNAMLVSELGPKDQYEAVMDSIDDGHCKTLVTIAYNMLSLDDEAAKKHLGSSGRADQNVSF